MLLQDEIIRCVNEGYRVCFDNYYNDIELIVTHPNGEDESLYFKRGDTTAMIDRMREYLLLFGGE